LKVFHKECVQEFLERIEVMENLRRIRTCEVVEGKRRTVEILHREFAKSRQPSDLIEKQGGYECFLEFKLRRSRAVIFSLRYPSFVGSDRSCTRFNSHKQSEAPERRRDIGVLNSGYRKSRGQEIGSLHRKNLDFDLDRPSIETRGRDQEPVGILATGVLS
jgi:hypothetical protein